MCTGTFHVFDISLSMWGLVLDVDHVQINYSSLSVGIIWLFDDDDDDDDDDMDEYSLIFTVTVQVK